MAWKSNPVVLVLPPPPPPPHGLARQGEKREGFSKKIFGRCQKILFLAGVRTKHTYANLGTFFLASAQFELYSLYARRRRVFLREIGGGRESKRKLKGGKSDVAKRAARRRKKAAPTFELKISRFPYSPPPLFSAAHCIFPNFRRQKRRVFFAPTPTFCLAPPPKKRSGREGKNDATLRTLRVRSIYASLG